MRCSVCRHCGLCGSSGAGKNISVVSDFPPVENFCGDFSLPLNFAGIAFDIGTTSVAARLFTLKDGIPVSFLGEENCQADFGSDVVSRITFSCSPGGLEKLHRAVLHQIDRLASRLLFLSQNFFTENRRGRPLLRRIVVSGNTAMESFALGISAASLSQFPFSLPDKFGFSIPAERLGKFDVIPPDCEFYFSPAVESFVGGDTVCAMLSSGFMEQKENAFLVDIGTNCEMCVRSADSGKIFCASVSAGPAFEGYGIECGIPAQKGAIAEVSFSGDGKIKCGILGDEKAVGICGTGIVSAVSAFLANGIIDSSGAFYSVREKIELQDGIFLSQKDIRNFQLAKSAVATGLEILSEKSGCKSGVLYLAGGFGSLLPVKDACAVGMIPEFLSFRCVSSGNASLGGASLFLLDLGLRKKASAIAENAVHVDLVQNHDFQELYIKNLNF
ncbi:ASKHA domain-containing protein [Treponema sp.]|uniref:ASKHA domain-containing protein n=1 Tax=Treponema sp. TaxID=166 RepID=UPI003F0A47DB